MGSPPPSPLSPYSNATAESDLEQYFNYNPSIAVAGVFAIVFLLLSFAQFYLYWKHRPDGYMLVLAFTALIGESLGYATRIIAIQHPGIGTYIVTTLLILLSPCATALVNYIVCGRVLAFTGQNVGCLRPTWIARIFLASDIVTFLIQAMGGSLTVSTNPSVVNLGKYLVDGGLVVQILSFCLFIYVAVSIQFMRRYGFHDNRPAQRIFWGIHATTVCLIVRTVYRLVEFAGGPEGYVFTHEWPLYAFDAGAMTIAFLVYSWPSLHFGNNLNQLSEAQRSCAAQPPSSHFTAVHVMPSNHIGSTVWTRGYHGQPVPLVWSGPSGWTASPYNNPCYAHT